MGDALTVVALPGIPEVVAGDDLAVLIGDAVDAATETGLLGTGLLGTGLRDTGPRGTGLRDTGLLDGDILAVTSKIVSKAEGRIRPAAEREQAIDDETVRVVATRTFPTGVTRIVENRLGIIGAAAGVDASNTAQGTVLLLPLDPDASAAALRSALEERFGVRLGVIITDTLGRAWREGQTDVAIGGSGVHLLTDLAGTVDASGRPLGVTAPAVGDEIAAAADLVKGKASGCPVAVVRGRSDLLDPAAPGARVLQRQASKDWFRLGSEEAFAEGYAAGVAAVADAAAASSSGTQRLRD